MRRSSPSPAIPTAPALAARRDPQLNRQTNPEGSIFKRRKGVRIHPTSIPPVPPSLLIKAVSVPSRKTPLDSDRGSCAIYRQIIPGEFSTAGRQCARRRDEGKRRGEATRRRCVQYVKESHPESSGGGREHAGDGKWFIVATGRVVRHFSGRGRSSTLSGRGRPVKIRVMRNTVFDKGAREKAAATWEGEAICTEFSWPHSPKQRRSLS